MGCGASAGEVDRGQPRAGAAAPSDRRPPRVTASPLPTANAPPPPRARSRSYTASIRSYGHDPMVAGVSSPNSFRISGNCDGPVDFRPAGVVSHVGAAPEVAWSALSGNPTATPPGDERAPRQAEPASGPRPAGGAATVRDGWNTILRALRASDMGIYLQHRRTDYRRTARRHLNFPGTIEWNTQTKWPLQIEGQPVRRSTTRADARSPMKAATHGPPEFARILVSWHESQNAAYANRMAQVRQISTGPDCPQHGSAGLPHNAEATA